MSGAPSGPLTRGASTTAVNPAEVAPFSVNLIGPEVFDPSRNDFNHRLPLRYEIIDPNERIRSGRILYIVGTASGDTVIKRTILSAEHWTPGAHVLPDSLCWNGQIEEGLADRRNEFITADLSPFTVRIELWNNSESDPARRVRGGNGRTERTGEWLASSSANVYVDCIVEARWERHWCIPWQDPAQYEDSGDEAKGKVRMTIRVKNVREDTPVELQISRIMDPDNFGADELYTGTGLDPDNQPGLENLIVQNRRVFSPDASGDPYVRFNRYEQHWVHPGNNFYCFAIRFLPDGGFMPASERDYVNQERACLHMRFTVFIHCPPSDLYVSPARQLRSQFRASKYYRVYFLQGPPASADDFWRRSRRRYLTVHMGHGAAACMHWEHPRTLIPNTGHAYATLDSTPVRQTGNLTLRLLNRLTNQANDQVLDVSSPGANTVEGVRAALNAVPGVHAFVISELSGTPRHYLVAIHEDPLYAVRLLDGAGANILAFTSPRDPYHFSFNADAYTCPVDHNGPSAGDPLPSWAEEHGFPGCGNNSYLVLQMMLGRRGAGPQRVRIGLSTQSSPTLGRSVIAYVENSSLRFIRIQPDESPRFMMWNGGCRQMLGQDWGQTWTQSGTRYFHGWAYSVAIVDNGQLINDVFREYLASDPSECATENFESIYHRRIRRGQFSRWQGRLYGNGGIITAAAPSPGPGEALA